MKFAPLSPTLRLITSGLLIFATLAGVASVSSALLGTNDATATNNTFTTGSAGLEIAADVSNGPGTYSTSIPGFSATNLVPGDTRTYKFWLRNSSSTGIDLNLFADLENVSYQNNAIPTPITAGGTDLDTLLKTSFSCDVINTSDDGSTPLKTIAAWLSGAAEQFDETGTVKLAATTNNQAQCTMTATLESSSASVNHTVKFDAVFTGQQIAPVTP